MKKQAFALTLGVVLFSVMVAMGLLIGAQAHKNSSGGVVGGPPQGGEGASD